MTHDPAMTDAIEPKPPLRLAGHTHKLKVSGGTNPDGTPWVLVVNGSTGGAGLRVLDRKEENPMSAVIITVDRQTKQALYLVVAKDIIKNMEEDPYLGEGGNGSLTFYAEVVPYNEDFVYNQLLPTWQEQWEQVQQGRAGKARYINTAGVYGELKPASTGRQPNAAVTGTFNPCEYCDLVAACKTNLLQSFRRR